MSTPSVGSKWLGPTGTVIIMSNFEVCGEAWVSFQNEITKEMSQMKLTHFYESYSRVR